ncbi:hypothetical protein XENOCAPTIV_006919, partial [Xenoophorus captivus]
HWLVVTEEGNMVTARQEPRLVLVSLSYRGGHAYLNGPDMEELKLPVKQPDNPILNCRFHITDSWEEIQIGSVRLQRVMACGSYRLCKPSEKHLYKKAPLFGQLHTVKKTGILHVGDEVYKITR